MDFPFLNTRLRYSCWATLFRYLPWLIHRSAISSKSGPTMGVAATTHDHNRLSSVPYYRLSRLARLCPPPITRVSLSLCVILQSVMMMMMAMVSFQSERKGSTTSWCRLDDKNRTWTSRETSSRVRGKEGGYRRPWNSKLRRKGRPRRHLGIRASPSLLREPVVQLHQTFRKIGKPFMRMCVCVFARNYGEKRFRFTSRVSDRRCGRKGW